MIEFTYLLIVFVVIIISMTLHEFAHAYVSYKLGDYSAKLQGRLTLNPIQHIDPIMTIAVPLALALIGAPIFGGAKPVPINPFALRWREWGMALVALAGPITNLLIAFVAFGVWSLSGYQSVGVLSEIVMVFVFVNLGFFVFNMIPIPPLDGSRVLYAMAPETVQNWMEVFEKYGIMVIFTFLLLFNNLFSKFISDAVNYIFGLFVSFFSIML